MRRSLSEAANYVLSEFDALEVSVPASSRIRQMCKVVCNSDGTSCGWIPESDPNFRTARETLRDITLLAFFFDQARKDGTNKATYHALAKRLIYDPVLPQDSMGKTTGRDAQAEAFMFAACRNAGMEVSFAEPDLICQIDGAKFAVAVKRVKTLRQLVERIKEGAAQVQKSGIPGVVSVDVSMAMNPDNCSIVSTGDEEKLKAWWTENMRTVVDRYHDKIQEVVKGKGIMRVLLHNHYQVKLNSEWVLRTMNYSVVTTDDKVTIKLAGMFVMRLLQGLPNLC